ncbi:MAG TPA: ABC transporter permease [Kineosporiaceae bacterium]|nr:ABC transporter permease [Kineosporiaceae bacterium]
MTQTRPITDALAAAERLVITVRRDPASIVMVLAAPAVLVLIFGYIFGAAIQLPGSAAGSADYREFLIPGLLVTMAFNIIPSMVSIARDTDRGIVDRFRSLPISRSAIPAGQAIATSLYAMVGFVVMMLCGLAVGWRIRDGAIRALAALALLVLFQFAMTWVGMYLGQLLGKEEAAGQASILVLPLGMVSNVFVPTTGMPGWLRLIADWNPISAASAAVRNLFGNPGAPTNGAWPLEHPVTATLIWIAVILAVFAPLCTARYARTGR